MRTAPPAEAALASGRAERALILALHIASALVLAAWLHSRLNWPLEAALGLPLPGLAVLGWFLATWGLPPGPAALRWDSQVWSVHDRAGQPQPLQGLSVQLDLGPWLLLRLRLVGPPPRTRWVVLNQASADIAWHGIRVALKAHAGQARPNAAQGPGDSPG